ncbi:hypothetical protein [Azotobacter chroococcum]|uniref:hypothetical protein n=1 Tax=Azotobacter chroococcum TaxID=353 RepID=UPI0011851979|nr:hypothetical protein [Azotobacter chroococcum]
MERIDDGAGEYQDQLENPGTNIVVDFNYGAAGDSAVSEADGLPGNPARRGRYEGTAPRPDAQMHRRLSSLLRMLIESPHFRNSGQILEIEGRRSIPVRNFFVPILSIDRPHIGGHLGLWGLISDARYDSNGTLWLNSGGRDHISFGLSPQIAPDVISRFHVSDLEDLAGAYVLVFGTPQVSSNGKLYCIVDGIECIALRLT